MASETVKNRFDEFSLDENFVMGQALLTLRTLLSDIDEDEKSATVTQAVQSIFGMSNAGYMVRCTSMDGLIKELAKRMCYYPHDRLANW